MTHPSRNPYRSPSTSTDTHAAAPAALVNRTHRIVRERAKTQSDRKRLRKSLWIPLSVCSALVLIISTGVWTALAQNDLSPAGIPTTIPDAGEQMLVFLLWFFPVSAALLAMVWFNKTRSTSGSESAQ